MRPHRTSFMSHLTAVHCARSATLSSGGSKSVDCFPPEGRRPEPSPFARRSLVCCQTPETGVVRESDLSFACPILFCLSRCLPLDTSPFSFCSSFLCYLLLTFISHSQAIYPLTTTHALPRPSFILAIVSHRRPRLLVRETRRLLFLKYESCV